VASSWLAPSVPAICGNATLAIEVSSTSMKVASVTVSAINHGLCLGCHPSTEEWWTRRAAFGCGANVAVTNAYPGIGSLFLDCTKLWCAAAPPSCYPNEVVRAALRTQHDETQYEGQQLYRLWKNSLPRLNPCPSWTPWPQGHQFPHSESQLPPQSTCCLALYPSRAMTSYFIGWCFSSCIFNGWPSLSTSSTRIFR
jgi:hypothetical protein